MLRVSQHKLYKVQLNLLLEAGVLEEFHEVS
jgi:hypothetical protein